MAPASAPPARARSPPTTAGMPRRPGTSVRRPVDAPARPGPGRAETSARPPSEPSASTVAAEAVADLVRRRRADGSSPRCGCEAHVAPAARARRPAPAAARFAAAARPAPRPAPTVRSAPAIGQRRGQSGQTVGGEEAGVGVTGQEGRVPQHVDQQVAVGERAVDPGPRQRAASSRPPPSRRGAARRSPWPASGRSARRPPCRRPTPESSRMPGRASGLELAVDARAPRTVQPCRSAAASPGPGPRRTAGPRSRARWAPAVRGQPVAAGDLQLQRDQVQPGIALGDRVLDLQPGVHLQEVEPAVVVGQELDGARRRCSRPPAAAAAPPSSSSLAQPGEPLDQRRRRLLDDLLVPALDRALPLADRPDRAVRSARTCTSTCRPRLEVPLAEHRPVAEGRRRLGRAAATCLGQLGQVRGRSASRGRRRRPTP